MVSEQKWCWNLQATYIIGQGEFRKGHPTPLDCRPSSLLGNRRRCFPHRPTPPHTPCYDVYWACREANWKRHHALSFCWLLGSGKSQERQGNHFNTASPLPFPQKTTKKLLWFRFMDSIYWPSGPCELCHLGDNDLHFLESAVYNDCKDTRVEWKGEHFKGT